MQYPLDTVLHETQHGIQQEAGWARGGSPESFAIPQGEAMNKIDFLNQELSRLAKEMDTAKGDFFKELKTEYDSIMMQKLKLWGDATTNPYDKYRSLAGEVEARDTSNRMLMNLEQRRKRMPLASENIPLDEMIVKETQ